ncbi:Protein trichome birefringence-like [Actinidia chinensis var. chinensis]|uniref:Protein trichome birefringence-like n=1 Tax=Actinidia chinensis var. chinensis TaxID=1590841 RepID=A0A2R6RKK7_ACTCC|nr:Protein trichome birefringence-like [Actinidia chinensis var. chinensis]
MHDNLSFLLRSNVYISGPFHYNLVSMDSWKKCNLFSGKWVPYPKGPYYTNESGCVIDNGQNCFKFGRPDTDFLKWRWKPDECELPLFSAAQFLELVRGKSMAFVGDSLARNQVQSLACLLSSVARPVDKSYAKYPRFKQWIYPDYNFTLALLTTTNLVKSAGANTLSGRIAELYLDEVDEAWASQVKTFDYVIISAGHWFTRPLMYREREKIVGCSMCNKDNITDLTRYYGYRKAFKVAFRTLLDLDDFKGTVILRTISQPHFEGEDSEGGGYCVRKRPYTREELRLDWDIWMYYLVQVEEFLAAKKEGEKKLLKFWLLDITEATMPRPDGHPNHYGHPNNYDCLHWCLPGPIDTWNELLLQLLKTKDDGFS